MAVPARASFVYPGANPALRGLLLRAHQKITSWTTLKSVEFHQDHASDLSVAPSSGFSSASFRVLSSDARCEFEAWGQTYGIVGR